MTDGERYGATEHSERHQRRGFPVVMSASLSATNVVSRALTVVKPAPSAELMITVSDPKVKMCLCSVTLAMSLQGGDPRSGRCPPSSSAHGQWQNPPPRHIEDQSTLHEVRLSMRLRELHPEGRGYRRPANSGSFEDLQVSWRKWFDGTSDASYIEPSPASRPEFEDSTQIAIGTTLRTSLS
ncbi:uncharacterized protein B0I36DRAFT_353893 [Microdochium trichocladiopsis]|uniref:Uncharacterized protein n=1 Tax=Microdochium trichocladiopsis TaxID=1682393 RepID=A0A9P8XZ57_9PEZI|nr:uncharacterized protein B0I36DRAFT_353893 [Microdochium trichocladiopsis]KAH7021204.1 hypothetical protein B0I36DRAFT_353893 [Microdochium trichocladiopsis]